MSDIVTGVVEKINYKKTAKGTFYSINVDGDWFGFGKEEPDFGEGSEIEFEVEVNGDFENVNLDTLEVLELVEAEKKGRGSRGSSRSSRGSKRDNKSSRSSSRSSRSSRGSRNNDDDDDDKPSRGSRGGRNNKSSSKADVDWDLKDQKIQWQSCRNAAIEMSKLAIESGAIKLPAKQADKLDVLEAFVQEKTLEFFQDIQDHAWENQD